MFISRDRIKMILQTVKYLRFDGTEDRPEDLEVIRIGEHVFTIVNLHGLKHLLRMNKTVFEFNNDQWVDSKTDLIPNEYEGGFKVWECTNDLLCYLIRNETVKENSRVCDLGCGSGILGVHSLKEKAESVHFLDYNKEVLQWFTLVNILNNLVIETNTEDELLDWVLKNSNFYPGDWSIVDKELNDFKYDLILTSETIYSKDNYAKLLDFLKNHLKLDGEIYLAAKVNYFGLNGGIFEFVQFVENDGTFNVDVVETILDNLTRKIIKLTFKNSN